MDSSNSFENNRNSDSSGPNFAPNTRSNEAPKNKASAGTAQKTLRQSSYGSFGSCKQNGDIEDNKSRREKCENGGDDKNDDDDDAADGGCGCNEYGDDVVDEDEFKDISPLECTRSKRERGVLKNTVCKERTRKEAIVFIPGFNSSLTLSLGTFGQFLALGAFPPSIVPFLFAW